MERDGARPYEYHGLRSVRRVHVDLSGLQLRRESPPIGQHPLQEDSTAIVEPSGPLRTNNFEVIHGSLLLVISYMYSPNTNRRPVMLDIHPLFLDSGLNYAFSRRGFLDDEHEGSK